MIRARGLRIWADPTPFDDSTPRIAIDREFGGDHTTGSDTFLHPLLERREETVLRSVSWAQPLPKVVRLVATPAMPHPREQVELKEVANSLISHPPAHRRKEVQVRLGTIVSTLIDDDLAAALLERR